MPDIYPAYYKKTDCPHCHAGLLIEYDTQAPAINLYLPAESLSMPVINIEKKETKTPQRHHTCRNCGQPGHRQNTCPHGDVPPDPPPKPPIADDEERDLIDRIKELWVETDANSRDVCIELGISLGKFNSLLVKHKITKNHAS